MNSTKYVFLTLGFLAVTSVASVGLPTPPSTGDQSCQQRSETSVGQWKSSIADSGSNPDSIEKMLNLLDISVTAGLRSLCGKTSGGTSSDDVRETLLGAVDDIVKILVDLLLEKTTTCIAQKQCDAISTACIFKCQTIVESGELLEEVSSLLENFLNGCFGSDTTSTTYCDPDVGGEDNLPVDGIPEVKDLLNSVLSTL